MILVLTAILDQPQPRRSECRADHDCGEQKADALRLLGWLKSEKGISPSLGGVFGSERLGQAVQAFMDHLRVCGRLYSTCAGYTKSFVAVARFVHATRVARAPQGTAVSTAPVDAMRCAHR